MGRMHGSITWARFAFNEYIDRKALSPPPSLDILFITSKMDPDALLGTHGPPGGSGGALGLGDPWGPRGTRGALGTHGPLGIHGPPGGNRGPP